MTSVHDLTDEELRAELEQTRSAYAEYVRDVGEYPSHSTRDLDDEARRHLDVREELDRRAAGHHDDARPRDAGGQAGGGHADPAEQTAARRASHEDAGSGQGPGDRTSGRASDQRPLEQPSGDRPADHEDLPDKLDPSDIEPYA